MEPSAKSCRDSPVRPGPDAHKEAAAEWSGHCLRRTLEPILCTTSHAIAKWHGLGPKASAATVEQTSSTEVARSQEAPVAEAAVEGQAAAQAVVVPEREEVAVVVIATGPPRTLAAAMMAVNATLNAAHRSEEVATEEAPHPHPRIAVAVVDMRLLRAVQAPKVMQLVTGIHANRTAAGLETPSARPSRPSHATRMTGSRATPTSRVPAMQLLQTQLSFAMIMCLGQSAIRLPTDMQQFQQVETCAESAMS